MYKLLPIIFIISINFCEEINSEQFDIVIEDPLFLFEEVLKHEFYPKIDDTLFYAYIRGEKSAYLNPEYLIEQTVSNELSTFINPDHIIVKYNTKILGEAYIIQIGTDVKEMNPEERINYFLSKAPTIDSLENIVNLKGRIIHVFPVLWYNLIPDYKKRFEEYKLINTGLDENTLYNYFTQSLELFNLDNEDIWKMIDLYQYMAMQYQFTIYIDETIDNQKTTILENIIYSLFPNAMNCSECIRFISTNIDSMRQMAEIKHQPILLNREDIYDDSWAVIIGIDKYKFSDQLNYAVKDAEAVKEMLINKFDFPEENIRYLTDEQATLSNIKLNLGEVATSAGENDRILVFYSGHGQTLIGADKSEKGYIIPYEGKQDNPYATGIAMDEILTTSQMSKSKHMLFLMDACYSGLMTEHVKGLSKPKEDGYLSKVANEKARQIITAGGNEPAIEGGRWNHSVFTKNLLEGLDDWAADIDNDGYITADELGTYLRKSVTEDSNNQQTPQKGRFINSGGGEFVFFSNHIINQNVEEISTDEKLDLLSRIERLESQSMADKTKPDLKVKPEIYKSTAYFKIGMTEKEFNRKNPNIIEKNEEEEFPIYIENCKDKFTYIAGIAFPLPRCEEYTFTFKNDTLEAVYRGRNNFNREIDYSMYPNAKP